ncbi:MAG TPA: AbrB/MazE/SpoVT family DNA-binding domain-containing protein [Thermoanaerobaculia bacterium]|nr:AbrB/MazE/SpoVT family DNA-binding domain-containing protein [Thermoanaerobaculia bacterium]
MRSGTAEATRIGKRGTVVIPVRMRKRIGLEEGALVLVEEDRGGVVIRPAVALPIEIYAPERKAEFLLENAVDRKDYALARKAVRKMGLDPDRIPHKPPRS